MLSRFAGRLITGPLAFLLAGLLDVTLFWLFLAWGGARRRMAAAVSRRS